jgi:DNA-binding CsgD family transcriptional regulator
MLELIHDCAVSEGRAENTELVFNQLGLLIPIDAAIIATGRHDHKRIRAIDSLHSCGPNEWLNSYRESELEQVDPIVQRAMTDDTPFRWSDAQLTHATSDRAYQSLKRNLGRRDGVAVAFRSRHHAGTMSLMSIAISERRVANRHLFIVAQLIPHIHDMLAHTVTENVHLTGRELEVLRWAAAGKSNWEIGVILALAERTVKFHLANVFTKLGAFNRAHAVAKAVRLGLVSL